MRTILLTSVGLKMPAIRKEVLKILPKPPQELKLTHITLRQNWLEKEKK